MNAPVVENDMLYIGDAARRLGVSIKTLRRYEAAGRISARRTPGNQRKFSAADIDRLANRK